MKIFLLDQSQIRGNIIKNYLRSHNFKVDVFSFYSDAVKAIDNGYICFIIGVGIKFNIEQNLELLKLIRFSYSETSIIMMSLDDYVDTDVLKKAYKYGCDDIFKQPFLVEELDRKIARLLHVHQNIVHFGEYGSFDFKTGRFVYKHIQKYFSKKETRLLSILYSNRDNIVSFKMIQYVVWDGEDINVESIRSLIRRVRKKLSFGYIETVTSVGYSLKLFDTLPAPILRENTNKYISL